MIYEGVLSMYKIEAIVRPDRLSLIQEALVSQGFDDFVVAEVQGHGLEPRPTACYRGVTYEIPFGHQVRVEFSVPDSSLEVVVDCIVKAARTGQAGDGRIFVTPLSEVIEIGLDRQAGPESRPSVLRPQLAATADAGWPRGW
jgi:nitrogen regulatory protein P-II 1